MKTLVIYDSTGKIWLMAHGETEVPQGLLCMFVDIPDGAILTKIDVTNVDDPQPVFEYLPDTDISRLQKAVKELNEENTAIKDELNVNILASIYVAETFTDEQALTVPSLYPVWYAGSESYKKGKRVNHEGVLYTVLQDHVSQYDWAPDKAPSLFAKVLVEDPNVIVEWEQPDSTNGYMTSNKVTHNGVVYESLVDNNVWEPGTTGSETVWKVVTE